MSQVTFNMQDLAQRLIDHETRSDAAADGNVPAGFSVCEKLRPHLATLMGTQGFQVLLSRALHMARDTDDWLRAVQVTADGSLEMSNGSESTADSKGKAKSSVVLVTQLLSLLAAFIGEQLTVRLVCEAWPRLSVGDSGLDPRNKK